MSAVEASYAKLVDYDSESDEESSGPSADKSDAKKEGDLGKADGCQSNSGLQKRRVDVVGKPQIDVRKPAQDPGGAEASATCELTPVQVGFCFPLQLSTIRILMNLNHGKMNSMISVLTS